MIDVSGGLDGLKAYMRYKGVSQAELSKELGVTLTTFNLKINEKGTGFGITECHKIAEYLDLSNEQILGYFFNR